MTDDAHDRIIELTIDKLVAGGSGLALADGKVVFVHGVLPGERIRAVVTEERRDYSQARCVEILSPSPKRREPPCPLAGVCGGCDWLHISYHEQAALKRAIVAEALSRVGGLEIGPLELETGSPLHYRNRAQVHRNREGKLGFMGFHTNVVVPVKNCPVASPEVNRVFREGVSAEAPRINLFGAGGHLAVGPQEITVTVCGRPFVFSADCFFQSNIEMLEKLVPFALAGLGTVDAAGPALGSAAAGPALGSAAAETSRSAAAADLYCGVGVFAAHMAPRFGRLILVESDARSVSFARRNVQGSGLEIHAMPVEQWIARGDAAALDAVLADPPREGLSAAVRSWLCSASIRRLVYVSCNPVTLARDLKALLSGGYSLTGIRLFDFYPQTSHVESVAWLTHNGT